MKFLFIIYLFSLILIAIPGSVAQQQHKLQIPNHRPIDDTKIEYPEEKSIYVPLLSDIQSLLRPTVKTSDESNDIGMSTEGQESSSGPSNPSEGNIGYEESDPKPTLISIELKPENSADLTENEDFLNVEHWNNGGRKPADSKTSSIQVPNTWNHNLNSRPLNSPFAPIPSWAQPNLGMNGKPTGRPEINKPSWSNNQAIVTKQPNQRPANQQAHNQRPHWDDPIVPASDTHSGKKPNTIQEWMNEMRPVNQKPPPRPPGLTGDLPQWLPNAQTGQNGQNGQNDTKPITGKPAPIKPSYEPAPWEKPKPNHKPLNSKPNYNDDLWWDSEPNKPFTATTKTTPKPPKYEIHNQWESAVTEKPKFKPIPNLPMPPMSLADEPWWSHAGEPMARPSGYQKPIKPKPESTPEIKPPTARPTPPQKQGKPEPPPGWTGNPNMPSWWSEIGPARPHLTEPEPEGEINGWGGNIFGDNTGNGIGGMGNINGIGGALVGNNSGNGEGGVGIQNGIGGNILENNGANGVGGVGDDNGQGGFIIGHDSGNGKGGVGNQNGVGGNKGGKNSANGTGGVGNNNGKGGIIIGSHSGNGVGGVNQNSAREKPVINHNRVHYNH